ncbi:hypothetical protein C0J52_28047, partial [Blattella germanica]
VRTCHPISCGSHSRSDLHFTDSRNCKNDEPKALHSVPCYHINYNPTWCDMFAFFAELTVTARSYLVEKSLYKFLPLLQGRSFPLLAMEKFDINPKELNYEIDLGKQSLEKYIFLFGRTLAQSLKVRIYSIYFLLLPPKSFLIRRTTAGVAPTILLFPSPLGRDGISEGFTGFT